jgi:5-methylthioadenosine/S-adenosylhomocysteine deaminase
MIRRRVSRLRGARALLGAGHALSPAPVDISLAGGRITAIEAASDAPLADDDLDARGRLVAPGTINGHQHSHEHFQKGRLENLPLEIWTHYLRSPRPVPWTPRQVYLRTLIGAIEALRSGCTTLVDDLALGPTLPRDHLAAVHQAYEDIGIRALVGFAMFDKPVDTHFPYIADECSPAGLELLRAIPVPDRDAMLALCDELAQTRHPSRSRVATVFSASAPMRCTDDFLRAIRALADRHAMPVIIHVQETRLQVVAGAHFYGCTMLEHLHRLGFLAPSTSLIHAVWLNPREMEILARTGATAQHNPWSNLAIGSGVQPMRELLSAGVNVSLGSDGTASSMSTNMHTVMGSAAGLSKVREADFEQWINAGEVFAAATLAGGRALGFGEALGRIDVGCIADLAGYRLDAVSLLPLNDPLRQLVYGERGEGVDFIIVDGELAMQDGALTGIDEHAIAEEIGREHALLAPRFAENERAIEPIRESMARIYRRSLQESIAADTFAARLGLPRP